MYNITYTHSNTYTVYIFCDVHQLKILYIDQIIQWDAVPFIYKLFNLIDYLKSINTWLVNIYQSNSNESYSCIY